MIACNELDYRWFTPAVEVNLCGHATLATAHILFTEGGKDPRVPRPVKEIISFDTLSGILTVQKLENGMLRLNFPQGILEPN